MSRRRVDVGDGVAYETCDPEPSDPRTKEALAEMARAAIKHVREQQRVQWEYYQDCWDLYPSIDQAMQRITNLGEQGWELVAITMPPAVSMDGYPGPHRKMAIFKRAAR